MNNRIESAAIARPEPGGDMAANPSTVGFDDTHEQQSGIHDDSGTRWAHGLASIASPRIAIAVIIAIGALLFLVNLGGYPLYTKGEPREAVTIYDIVHGGGVILPMRAGVEVPSKPLLMHWIAALISLAVGDVNEWTVRLPSAIFAILGMVACYWYVRRLFDERAALISALILGTSFQYMQAGSGCRVDMTLTFFMEVAFFEFALIAEGLTTRTAPLYFAMAFAVLTKGPIGAALPILAAAIWIAAWGRWDLIRQLRLARGALIVGVVGGGWYLAAIAAGGMQFVHKQILAENLYRLVPHSGFNEGHAHPFYYEEAALMAGFMPWTPVAILAAIQYLRRPRKIDSRVGYLVVWFLTVLVFYNLPQSKRGVYLLALYPALSTMVAILLCEAIERRDAIASLCAIVSRAAGAFFALTGVAGLIALTMLHFDRAPIQLMLSAFGFTARQLPYALESAAAAIQPFAALLPIVTAGIGAYMMFSRPLVEKMATGITAGIIFIALAVNLVVEPAIANTLSLKDFAARTIEFAGGRDVGYFGNLDYAYAFYSGGRLNLTSPRNASAPDLIVSPEDDWKLVPPRMRERYAIVFRSNPTDLDGTGRMLLLRRSYGAASPPASSNGAVSL